MDEAVDNSKTGGPAGWPIREQGRALALGERSPLGELLALAGPTVLQMASYTLMQFIDTWMLAKLGTTEAAAAAMSGLLAFAVMCFGIGIVQLVNTFASQHFGRGEYDRCGRYMWQGIWFSVGWSIVVLPALLVVGRRGPDRDGGSRPSPAAPANAD